MKSNVIPVSKKLKIRVWRRGHTQWRYQTQMSGRCNREEKPIDVHWIVWTHSIIDLEELENQKNKKKDTFHQEKNNSRLTKSSLPYYEPSQLLGHPVVKCERYNNCWKWFPCAWVVSSKNTYFDIFTLSQWTYPWICTYHKVVSAHHQHDYFLAISKLLLQEHKRCQVFKLWSLTKLIQTTNTRT
jgi:hypothetical protein